MQDHEIILKNQLPNLLLVAALLVTVTGAIATAAWADGLWGIVTVALLGAVVGYLFAISDFSTMISLLMSSVYGVFIVGVQAIQLLPHTQTALDRILTLFGRLGAWIWNIASDETSRDNLIFIILLGLLFWYLSFNAAWNLFRAQRLWSAVLPPGVALLINIHYYYGPARMDLLLLAYLFWVFALAIRTTAITREWLWRRRHAGFSPDTRLDLVRAGVLTAIVLLILAWVVPPASASSRLAEAWERASNRERIQDTWNRLFGALRGGRVIVADYYGGARLRMGGPINLGDTHVMTVTAPEGPRYYWRSRLFDTYEDGSWTGASDGQMTSEFGALPYEEETYTLRTNYHQTFEIFIPASRLIYTASQPLSVNLPVRVEVDYTDPGRGLGTPVVVYAADEPLHAGDLYRVVSSISQADEASLRTAGTDYPSWARERYLQLPDTTTERTRDLAAELAAPHDNPYDVANAVESYLRREIAYDESIEAPPDDAEPVDHFLFESRAGYCTYYASAMVVLLRAQGIPARIAAGFAQGGYERQPGVAREETNIYYVAEADAHTWVEVYFPGYGWVEFEPTASEDPIERPYRAGLETGLEEPGFEDPTAGEIAEEPERNLGPEFDEADISELELLDRRLFHIPRMVLWIFGGSALIVLGGLAILFWVEHRGLYGLSEVSRSYARLNLYASWMGFNFRPGATPRERGEFLARTVPEEADAIQQIVQLYITEQYAPPLPKEAERIEANKVALNVWQRIRFVMLRRVVSERLAKYRTSL